MIQINLLPWRTEARKAQLYRFLVLLSLGLGLTLFLLILAHIYYGSLIDNQESRNQYLQTQLSEKQVEFNALREKRKKVDNLNTQLKVLTDLRATSFQVVSLMNALVKTAPSEIVLEKISRLDNVITIIGTAQSDAEVTVFMKALTKEKGFKQAVLTQINSEKSTNEVVRHFQLKVEQQDNS